jgi:hypothetical protein
MRALGSVLASSSLIGGYSVARFSGKRPAGGAVLLTGGAAAAWNWWRTAGPAPAVANSVILLGAFGVSHPLAKRIGAWPSVLAVSAVTAVATYAIASPRERAIEA